MSRRKQNRPEWSWKPRRPLRTWLLDGTRGRNERVILTYSRLGEVNDTMCYRAWHQSWRYNEFGDQLDTWEGRVIGAMRLAGVET